MSYLTVPVDCWLPLCVVMVRDGAQREYLCHT